MVSKAIEADDDGGTVMNIAIPMRNGDSGDPSSPKCIINLLLPRRLNRISSLIQDRKNRSMQQEPRQHNPLDLPRRHQVCPIGQGKDGVKAFRGLALEETLEEVVEADGFHAFEDAGFVGEGRGFEGVVELVEEGAGDEDGLLRGEHDGRSIEIGRDQDGGGAVLWCP